MVSDKRCDKGHLATQHSSTIFYCSLCRKVVFDGSAPTIDQAAERESQPSSHFASSAKDLAPEKGYNSAGSGGNRREQFADRYIIICPECGFISSSRYRHDAFNFARSSTHNACGDVMVNDRMARRGAVDLRNADGDPLEVKA